MSVSQCEDYGQLSFNSVVNCYSLHNLFPLLFMPILIRFHLLVSKLIVILISFEKLKNIQKVRSE